MREKLKIAEWMRIITISNLIKNLINMTGKVISQSDTLRIWFIQYQSNALKCSL